MTYPSCLSFSYPTIRKDNIFITLIVRVVGVLHLPACYRPDARTQQTNVLRDKCVMQCGSSCGVVNRMWVKQIVGGTTAVCAAMRDYSPTRHNVLKPLIIILSFCTMSVAGNVIDTIHHVVSLVRVKGGFGCFMGERKWGENMRENITDLRP